MLSCRALFQLTNRSAGNNKMDVPRNARRIAKAAEEVTSSAVNPSLTPVWSGKARSPAFPSQQGAPDHACPPVY